VGHYQSAVQRKPSLTQASENLAVIAESKGDVAGAMRLYEGIFSRYPQDASSRARLAEIFRKQNNQERAMELAKEALLRDPKLLLAYKVMIQSLMDQNQLSVAKLVTLKAIKVDENDPQLYQLAGRILLEEKDSAQASVQFKKAVQVSPDYVPARMELAKLALKSENYIAAREHLTQVLQVDGKNAEAHLDLGVTYKLLGQYDKALQEYELTEKLDPNLAAAYLDHAILLHRHKDAPERALELYKHYLTLVPEGSLPADAPVLALEHEAEQLVQVKAEAKRAEEEARKHPAPANPPEPKKVESATAVAKAPNAGSVKSSKGSKKATQKAAVAGTSKDDGDLADEPKE
jgi:tetratricopeptide (TPR) repeat protein